ncbi:hypothetical protein EaACW_2514 [Erwinia amylovora ACW56400]|uniref:Uncharacterized protein n=1 Tax=Erwinia amylovora ATCC BAA-2158 TaxID=889211 RepID=E5B7D0_ERWAM|nr:hypothetical protein EaACW_2514 [Erwinia amylovora ACW56400]CBX81383.1 hypothetical protein predicted by Glimmer/Critica [Erwinia amylovora ATCC BAA-2158]CCO86927.1 hypothetical protein BN434_2556 [Erwinia amylovora CFBP 2585]
MTRFFTVSNVIMHPEDEPVERKSQLLSLLITCGKDVAVLYTVWCFAMIKRYKPVGLVMPERGNSPH